MSGCASRDPSLQVENNTNRPLGLCKGWSLTAYRGDRVIGAAKYKFDHSIIMECRELLTDTQIHQPTLSTIITTDIFADSLHSPCWKDRLSKVFFRGLLSHSVNGVLYFSSEIESSILSISCLLHVNDQIHYGYLIKTQVKNTYTYVTLDLWDSADLFENVLLISFLAYMQLAFSCKNVYKIT